MKKARILSGILAAVLVLLAVVSACADLKKGSRGEEVKELQQQMIDLGVLEGSADGVYGKKTEAAVKKLQKYFALLIICQMLNWFVQLISMYSIS